MLTQVLTSGSSLGSYPSCGGYNGPNYFRASTSQLPQNQTGWHSSSMRWKQWKFTLIQTRSNTAAHP